MRPLPATLAFLCLLAGAGDRVSATGSAPDIPPLREVDSDPAWPPAPPRLRAALGVVPSLSTAGPSMVAVPSFSARGSFGRAFDYVVAVQGRSERHGGRVPRGDNIDAVWATIALSRSFGPVSLTVFANHGSGFEATFDRFIGHVREFGGSVSADLPGPVLGGERWTVSPSIELFRRLSAVPELRFQQVSPGIEARGRIDGLTGVFRVNASADLRSYDDGRRSNVLTVGAAWWRVVHRNVAVGVRAAYVRDIAMPRSESTAAFEFGPFVVVSFSTAPMTAREEEDLQPGRSQRF